MKKLGFLIAALAILTATACTSTKVTSSWRANGAPQLQRDQKIMVFAMVPQRDMALRSQMENYTVSELRRKGYNASSALQEFGPQQFGQMGEKQVVGKLRSSGASQVLTIVMLDKARQKQYVPGGVYYPYGPYGFWPYYSWWYGSMYTPGYYTVNTKYQWEGNLYDLQSGQLLYSVQSKSFDPPTTTRMAVLYAQQVVKDMTRQQLLANN
ncbi:hypothetical protein CLV59_102146 [Chitinophaga dinghuensis]|uniref:DUF4136 domain-containing protein n=1 Tax=Chitinophaga dinghuensis TaxID=1539050 RepID=A0A327W7U0_9BACT|nr:hypothetical protein [Chitinophaga dinghuensis]RAJ85443.1 hypothetical protein CLV59_102146 [Chitinophaga dinghuensis]